MHYLARCSLSELNTLWEWGDLSISESNLHPPLIWYVESHESDQSTRKTEGSLTPRQCCQMYDNYRIYTIILTSVRCTINNGKNPIMYDNFRVFSRSSKHTSLPLLSLTPNHYAGSPACTQARTHTHTHAHTHTGTTRCRPQPAACTSTLLHYSFAPWRHAICTVKGFPNQQHLPTQHKWMWHLMMTAT